MRRRRFLHGRQAEHLHQVILHDISDDSVLVKVSAAPFRPERLFESDEDAGDAFTVPRRAEKAVAEP